MSEPEMKSLLTTMKTVGHEALAHDLFFDCFPELGSVLQMGGMKTTSLSRMALLYFLFVPDARERLLTPTAKTSGTKRMKPAVT